MIVPDHSFATKLRNAVLQCPSSMRRGIRDDVRRLARLGVKTPGDAARILVDARRSVADRAICCWAIMVTNASEFVPELLFSFRGPALLTWGVAKALSNLADKTIVPLLERLAVDGERVALRAASAYVLGVLGTRKSGSVLVGVMKRERSAEVRQAAVEAIGRLGGKGAAGVVLRAMHDPVSGVRASACYACGLLELRRAVPELTRIASANRTWESQCAKEALAQLTRADES
jgi:hypothetical protein